MKEEGGYKIYINCKKKRERGCYAEGKEKRLTRATTSFVFAAIFIRMVQHLFVLDNHHLFVLDNHHRFVLDNHHRFVLQRSSIVFFVLQRSLLEWSTQLPFPPQPCFTSPYSFSLPFHSEKVERAGSKVW